MDIREKSEGNSIRQKFQVKMPRKGYDGEQIQNFFLTYCFNSSFKITSDFKFKASFFVCIS